ncbi:MAG TPA: response regulator [Tepidisphaeraceae bacterium]|jgi:CheY-like chemotaxis protein
MASPASNSGVLAPPDAPAALSLLLIDDHDDTREGLRRLLGHRGYQVLAAGTCAEALALAGRMSAGRLDVIISDVGLPDGDGVELMTLIKARHGCRSVALTGFGDQDDLRRYAQAGIDHCLVKPIDLSALMSALNAMARERRI